MWIGEVFVFEFPVYIIAGSATMSIDDPAKGVYVAVFTELLLAERAARNAKQDIRPIQNLGLFARVVDMYSSTAPYVGMVFDPVRRESTSKSKFAADFDFIKQEIDRQRN